MSDHEVTTSENEIDETELSSEEPNEGGASQIPLPQKFIDSKDSIDIPDVPNPPPSTPNPTPVFHYQSKAVDVTEDFYGTYIDTNGRRHKIQQFTWKNYNKLTVSVITYGARITCIKAPDKNGTSVDVLLGFDDVGSQVRNATHPLGACLGRCANYISESSFYLDRKVHNLTKNAGPHHYNGGLKGFDQAVWTPYVDKSKVIMTYVSNRNEEGYPGQLFSKITFELCNRNQFKIDYEAFCTEPTVVNLTHLCYFNLAGCSQGPQEIYNHVLNINSNCYTVQDNHDLPTGDIKNVVNTRYDFQIPKCLSKVIGIVPKDGYCQNFCINRGVTQEECFVARISHPPSGRMLEIYSSHPGVVFTTGNEFGTGEPIPLKDLLSSTYTCSTTSLVVGNIYKNVKELLAIDNRNDYFEMRDLIDLIKGVKLGDRENMDKIELTKMQRQYLEKIFHYCHSCEPKIQKCNDILDAIEAILREAKPNDSATVVVNMVEEEEIRERIMSQFTTKLTEIEETNSKKKLTVGKICGKTDFIYKAHCGIALTPGNYPNAINTNSFPNSVLRPGEVYRQSTSYRFWIRAGNPNNWIKRKSYEASYDEKQAAKADDQAKAAEIIASGLQKKTR